MDKITIKVEGLDKALRNLGRIGEETQRALAAALYQEAESIMGKSKEIVPVDTGTLRSTGHVVPPETEGDTIVVEMGYGGPAAPYAIYVHEDLTKHHIPPTQAKFLEQPAKEAMPGMADRLGEKVRRTIEGVRG